MTPRRAEIDLLPLALEHLKATTGLEGEVKPRKKQIDPDLSLRMPDRTDKVTYRVEVKRTLGGATAAHMAAKKDQYLLVTTFVNPLLAERLKVQGVQFFDCAGNAYINKGPYFVFVKGNKPETRAKIQQPRLFKPSGLQIIFALLCRPELINASYRTIAAQAEVALGTVAAVIRDLHRQGFIIEFGMMKRKNRRLIKKDVLLNLWVTGYEQLLRPRLLINRYHADNPAWWQEAVLEGGFWGGEVAANKLTGYLKPQDITLYAKKLPDRLLLKHKLRLDSKGEIEVMTPFWDFDYPENEMGVVPPLLIYADLMTRTDGRTTETAKMIYEEYLARHLKEN